MRNRLDGASIAQNLDGNPSDGEPAYPPRRKASKAPGGSQATQASIRADQPTHRPARPDQPTGDGERDDDGAEPDDRDMRARLQ